LAVAHSLMAATSSTGTPPSCPRSIASWMSNEDGQRCGDRRRVEAGAVVAKGDRCDRQSESTRRGRRGRRPAPGCAADGVGEPVTAARSGPGVADERAGARSRQTDRSRGCGPWMAPPAISGASSRTGTRSGRTTPTSAFSPVRRTPSSPAAPRTRPLSRAPCRSGTRAGWRAVDRRHDRGRHRSEPTPDHHLLWVARLGRAGLPG
jgi:hypothetical protein